MPKSKSKKINQYIIQELGKKVFWPWVLDALINWMIIICSFCMAAIWNHPVGYILAFLVIANRQHAMAIQGHDGTHFTIHKSRRVNDFFSDVMALFPIGLTTSGYRNLHFQHHQHLNTERDPELIHRSSKAPQWDLPITLSKILRLSVFDLFGYSISDYWMIISYSKANSKWTYVGLFVMHALFIGVCVAFGLYWVPLLWYWSLITAFMMLFRLRTWLEHQGSDDTHRLKLNWFERLLLAPHSVWHHYEHHSYPSISYHNLHLVREKLSDDPVISLVDLLKKYREIGPIPSGKAMR